MGYADFLDKYPGIPWRSMQNMRNRIAHGYFDIDLEVVWETLTISLPHLLNELPTIEAAAKGGSPVP
ncbi:HepT-like ribonuclease domain-containing protein [Pseudoduganella sp. OTU4001]|uniref:HepT-like ribonuclease domain-containing protein n=1 Tax=Pseudoduganella sp. OTU4001 TaxID=3043854 RepID=UPI00406D1B39